MGVREQLEAILRSHLEIGQQAETHNAALFTVGNPDRKLVYYGTNHILSKVGQFMPHYHDRDKGPLSAPQECFDNSALLALSNPNRYVYCEGYAVADGLGVCIHHAWVYDRVENMVVDPTWQKGRICVYYGIAFSTGYLIENTNITGYHSIFHYPSIIRICENGFPDGAMEVILL